MGLFSVEEADIARQIPLRPTPLKNLARKLNMPVEKFRDKISVMAEKGLVLDVEHKEEFLKSIIAGAKKFV